MSLARSYRVLTLGCKLNQFDSASIEGQLRRRGFALAAQDAPAGVFVVNTCTVTENADREARQLVRRARRENPGCRLIVTGCYAELDRETTNLATPRTMPDKRYIEYFLPGTEPAELRNNPWKVPQWGPLFMPVRPQR